jgi:HAD superfamily hydrolase (TIGR01509 family)
MSVGEIALNIVFDLGGVIFTWEPETIIAKVFADPEVQTKVRFGLFGHEDWRELDRGTLLRHEAIERAATRTGLPVSDIAELLRQVPPALVAIPETVDLLYRLKARGHRLFYLSNMHVASIEHLENVYAFWSIFEGGAISCHVHLIKPEPAIYTYLLQKYRLNGAETVFIDDTECNLEAAAKLGLQTIKFEHPTQCESQLKALGCF